MSDLRIIRNFVAMNIDDLFVANSHTASDKLKDTTDSYIEPVVQTLTELHCQEFDTLMAISFGGHEEYSRTQASTLGRLILDQLNCISERSNIAFRDGTFDWYAPDHCSQANFFDGKPSHNIVFVFKRNFNSAREILRMMNAVYSHLCMQTPSFIEFHTMRAFGFMNDEELKIIYVEPNRSLFVDCKKKEKIVNPQFIFENGCSFSELVNLVYKLLPENSNECQYEKLCDYLQISMFDTDATKFLIGKHGLKDLNYPVAICRTGIGCLENWSGRISIEHLCQESDNAQLILLTYNRDRNTANIETTIAATSNRPNDIKNFFRKTSLGDFKINPEFPDMMMSSYSFDPKVYVRQFNIYYIMGDEYSPTNSSTYLLLFRMGPTMVDGKPAEVVLSIKLQVYQDTMIFLTGEYRSSGTVLAQELMPRLGIAFPESFIKEFDYSLERVQEQQLKHRILYHGRQH